MRVAILISGGGSNMATLIDDMADGYAQPVLVLSNVDSAGGLDKARARGVPTACVDHRGKSRGEFDQEVSQVITDHAPDVICLAGFMRILTADFIARHSPILNIHPSLLPKYKGLNTHARAIEAGEVEAGCTVHQVVADLDAGPILGQARVPILAGDTAQTLAERVLVQEHILYPRVLRHYVSGERNPLFLG